MYICIAIALYISLSLSYIYVYIHNIYIYIYIRITCCRSLPVRRALGPVPRLASASEARLVRIPVSVKQTLLRRRRRVGQSFSLKNTKSGAGEEFMLLVCWAQTDNTNTTHNLAKCVFIIY